MTIPEEGYPGIFFAYLMHANSDATVRFELLSDYNRATETGTPIDLTGATLKASGIDGDGNEVWSVVPTAPVPTDGVIFVTVPRATSLPLVNTEGQWGLQVEWPGGLKTIEAYGPFFIGPELVG